MLILASSSPRRQELLSNAGIPFVVQPTDIPEIPQPGEGPRSCAERLAQDKALAVSRQSPSHYVLGADTIVVVEGEMLGKPFGADDAARMLRLLSGRSHQVITGVCLVAPAKRRTQSRKLRTASELTTVWFDKLGDEDIRFYVASGEPMDKAGAYGIQGVASRWISRIEGDYFNVVGLPVSLVFRMLREQGASL